MTYEVILMVTGLNELTVFIFVYIWTLLKDPVGTLPHVYCLYVVFILYVIRVHNLMYSCFIYTTLHILLLSHVKIMLKTHFPLAAITLLKWRAWIKDIIFLFSQMI